MANQQDVNKTQDVQRYPTVAALAEGGFVILWEGRMAGEELDVIGQAFDAQGKEAGGLFRVNQHTHPGMVEYAPR